MRGSIAASLVLITACTVDTAEPVIQTDPVWYMETAATRVGVDLETSAVDYVRAHEDELDLGLSDADDFIVTSVVEWDRVRHVRMQQVHDGVPVDGSEVIAHADDSTFLGLNGIVTRHLGAFDVQPVVTADEALATAHTDHGGSQTSGDTGELLIRPESDGSGAALIWRVAFDSPATSAHEAGTWTYDIDARSGRILEMWNARETLDQASGPGGNAKKANAWKSDLDVEADGDEFKMDTARFQTVNHADKDKVFQGPVDAMPDSVANDAHGYAEVTVNMLKNWMGRDSLDDGGFKIKSRVHDSTCDGTADNACWGDKQMRYGDGANTFYPLSGALDVVAHELNHGFTSFHSRLGYKNQPGALNESFSDVAGTVAEFYHEGSSADFKIAEDVMKHQDALRYMCDPTKDGRSIGDARNYVDGMNPHRSSGVANRAFCLAVARYKVAGEGTTTLGAIWKVGEIWYAANAAYWTSGSTYAQACRGTIDAARSLGQPSEILIALGDSWADVGVQCEIGTAVCNENDKCDVGDGETCTSCVDDCGSCSEECGRFKRAKCALHLDDCSRCDLPAGCGDNICSDDETDASCGQDCGCAALSCGQVAPFGCYCDAMCEGRGDCCADAGTCR